MKRLTTDAPKDNFQNALNLFYIKDREVWVRRYGPPPECPDISLDNLMRSLIAKFLPDVECPQDPVDFSCMMAEWLYDDVDTMEGPLALLYSAAWAFAELRERLKTYEETGLMPEDVLRISNLLRLVGEDFNCRLVFVAQALVRYAEYAKAESEGRLVVLPCKFGDSLYRIRRFKRGKNWTKESVHILSTSLTINNVANVLFGDVLGKTVFLTREEAEAALAEVTDTNVGNKGGADG